MDDEQGIRGLVEEKSMINLPCSGIFACGAGTCCG
jgi:hypothetical protein